MSDSFEPLAPELLIDHIANSIGANQSYMTNVTYETGNLGTALFYYYYGRYKHDESSIAKANDLVELSLNSFALNTFEKAYGTDSIDNHLSNIGRFVEFAKFNKLIDIDPNSYLKNFDEILFQLMKTKLKLGDLDVNSGAIASGDYFLSRLASSNNCREPLEFLVENLHNIANVDEDGNYFWKSPSLHGRIYFGLSHGSAMVISFLSKVASNGISVSACHELIKKSVGFLLKHRRTQDKGLFPIQLHDEVEPKQFSMCYGDLGVGYALLKAAVVLKNQQLEDCALNILLNCADRTRLDGLTLDASITYGASGLAATFGKLNQILSHPKFGIAEKYWYNQIPYYGFHTNAFAGFKSRLVDPKPIWNMCMGWGIIGIGISLLINQEPLLPKIDKLLMIA